MRRRAPSMSPAWCVRGRPRGASVAGAGDTVAAHRRTSRWPRGRAAGAGEAPGQWLRGHRSGAQMPLAVRAAILATDMAQHPHLGGDDVELLAHHLAEAFQLDPVMQAGPLVVRQRMLDVDTRQSVGQRSALRCGAPMGGDLGGRSALGLLRRAGLGLVEQPSCPSGSFSDEGAKCRASSRRTCASRCSILASRSVSSDS